MGPQSESTIFLTPIALFFLIFFIAFVTKLSYLPFGLFIKSTFSHSWPTTFIISFEVYFVLILLNLWFYQSDRTETECLTLQQLYLFSKCHYHSFILLHSPKTLKSFSYILYQIFSKACQLYSQNALHQPRNSSLV